jgi:hypothetical protein
LLSVQQKDDRLVINTSVESNVIGNLELTNVRERRSIYTLSSPIVGLSSYSAIPAVLTVF